MEYRKLGRTGLNVSRICVGGMSFGTPGVGKYPWALGEKESIELLCHAFDQGINFVDTANMYGKGESERIIGKAIKQYGNRDDVVIATKLFYSMYDGVNAKGLSRKAIFREVDKSLERLGTDYIDLYIIHRFDEFTPVEETMEALDILIRAGKVRYIGASYMKAWQLSKMQYTARMHGWHEFVSMQSMYNLLYREDEREMIPLLKDMGMVLTPYSPLARGKLAKDPHDHIQSAREKSDPLQNKFFGHHQDEDVILDRVGELAKKHQVTRAMIAEAWLYSKDFLAAPLIGSTKIKNLDEAIAALDLHLTDEEIQYLEEPYQAHELIRF